MWTRLHQSRFRNENRLFILNAWEKRMENPQRPRTSIQGSSLLMAQNWTTLVVVRSTPKSCYSTSACGSLTAEACSKAQKSHKKKSSSSLVVPQTLRTLLSILTGKPQLVVHPYRATAVKCRKTLNQFAAKLTIIVAWIPEHSEISGNLDELARMGTNLHMFR